FLQCLRPSKPRQDPFSSSKRLMRVFRPIVEPPTNLMPIGVADLSHRRGIGTKPIGDDAPRSAIFLHDPLQKLQRRSLVPLRRDHRLQNLALVIDSPPEIAELAVDLHKDLIQMPTPLGEAAHVRYPPLSDLGGEHRAKPVPPKSDSLMADVDPALGQQILDVAQRQRVSHVHHHDQTDHFWRAVEISERVAHGPKLPQPEAARKIGLTMPAIRPIICACARSAGAAAFNIPNSPSPRERCQRRSFGSSSCKRSATACAFRLKARSILSAWIGAISAN